jgi:hypothetical protein
MRGMLAGLACGGPTAGNGRTSGRTTASSCPTGVRLAFGGPTADRERSVVQPWMLTMWVVTILAHREGS